MSHQDNLAFGMTCRPQPLPFAGWDILVTLGNDSGKEWKHCFAFRFESPTSKEVGHPTHARRLDTRPTVGPSDAAATHERRLFSDLMQWIIRPEGG